MPKYLSSCTGKGLEILCRSFASLFFMKKEKKKKKTEDLCSWVNFHLKLSSAVRQNSRISLEQRCACCHTLLRAFLAAHRCRYWGYRRFIQPDPCCWALGSTALENKQTNQHKTPNIPPVFSQGNQVHPAPLHLINPDPLNLTENPQA